jgi:putative protease
MPAVGPSLPGAFPVRLVVFTSDVLTAEVCLAAGADEAFVPHWVVRRQASVPAGIGVMLPRIAHDVEEGVLPAAIPQGTAVIADNLGLLDAYVHAGFRTEAGWPLNVVNSQAAAQLAEMGTAFVWLSPELTGAQIANVAAESPVGVGVVAFGRQELMVTEHCVLMAEGECVRACESCTRRRERHVLRDRKGYEFPVLSDPSGRSHVFNSVRLDLSGAVSDMLAGGVAALALDLRLESRAECARQVERFAGLLASARTRHAKHARTSGIERGDSPSTSGHYYRGVL